MPQHVSQDGKEQSLCLSKALICQETTPGLPIRDLATLTSSPNRNVSQLFTSRASTTKVYNMSQLGLAQIFVDDHPQHCFFGTWECQHIVNKTSESPTLNVLRLSLHVVFFIRTMHIDRGRRAAGWAWVSG
jgi:hypothetical protein